ncbi:MAG: hypothetical protein LBT49_03680 [Prevotellaceae bacterium]|jgi:hypothetical protein|nr:hypothetical protein [Prevotellaceae bacterium]
MGKNFIPASIAKFTEYIKIAYAKAQENLVVYGISPDKLAAVTPAYNRYIAAEALAADPDTATTGHRRERDDAKKVLDPLWRGFLNANIRYNELVPAADLEVFGIKRGDDIRTPAGVPEAIPMASLKRVGAFRFEAHVLDSATGKLKNPLHATGSYLYVAVTDLDKEPEHEDEFHKRDFSSNNKHVLEFRMEQKGKQANVYARYSNPHGKEGPEGPTEVIVIS